MLRKLSHRAIDTHQTLQVTKNINQVGRQRQNSNAMGKKKTYKDNVLIRQEKKDIEDS